LQARLSDSRAKLELGNPSKKIGDVPLDTLCLALISGLESNALQSKSPLLFCSLLCFANRMSEPYPSLDKIGSAKTCQ